MTDDVPSPDCQKWPHIALDCRADDLDDHDFKWSPPTDACPVCGASGTDFCTTVRGNDHLARALGWPTARRPK